MNQNRENGKEISLRFIKIQNKMGGTGCSMNEKFISMMLFFLYRGLRSCSRVDPDVWREFQKLPEDLVLEMGIAGGKTGIRIVKQQGKLIRMKDLPWTTHRLQIFFKSPLSATKLLKGQQTIATAYARNDLLISGEIQTAMRISRCLERVEGYLFPHFIKKNLFENQPVKKVSSFRVYLGMLY